MTLSDATYQIVFEKEYNLQNGSYIQSLDGSTQNICTIHISKTQCNVKAIKQRITEHLTSQQQFSGVEVKLWSFRGGADLPGHQTLSENDVITARVLHSCSIVSCCALL